MGKYLPGFLGWMRLLAGAQGEIAITNHEPGSTVRYLLVLTQRDRFPLNSHLPPD